MRLRWIWILGAVLIGCSTIPVKPSLAALDCAAREDCFVVKVDNVANRYGVEFRINGIKYGDISANGSATYSLYAEQLKHGNCAVVSAKMPDTQYRTVLYSEEQCIFPGQYFDVQITLVPMRIWFAPMRLAGS